MFKLLLQVSSRNSENFPLAIIFEMKSLSHKWKKVITLNNTWYVAIYTTELCRIVDTENEFWYCSDVGILAYSWMGYDIKVSEGSGNYV